MRNVRNPRQAYDKNKMVDSSDASDSTEEEHSQLPVKRAIIEIVEYIFGHLCHSIKCAPYGRGIKVRIKSIESDDAQDMSWFSIKVAVVGDAPVLLFSEDIFESRSSCLTQVLEATQEVEKESHLSYQSSMSTSLSFYQAEGDRIRLARQEPKKVTGRGGSASSVVFLRVRQAVTHMTTECQGVYNYLHKLKLFHPEMTIYLHLRIASVVSTSDFCAGAARATVGFRRLAVDCKHYFRQMEETTEDQLSRIFPKSGTNFTLLETRCAEDSIGPYRLVVIGAIIPPLPSGSRLSNQQLQQLQVLFYGPGDIPLILDNEMTIGLHLGAMLTLEDYGLSLGNEMTSQAEEGSGYVQQDMTLTFKPAEVDFRESQPDETLYRLQLFFMLDKPKEQGTFSDVDEDLRELRNLRKNLSFLIMHHKVKVKRALTSVLNKFLLNTSILNQKQNVIEGAINTVSKVITNIVKLSNNPEFKENCFSALQVDSHQKFKEAVSSQLWKISADNFQITAETARMREPATLTRVQQSKTEVQGAETSDRNSSLHDEQQSHFQKSHSFPLLSQQTMRETVLQEANTLSNSQGASAVSDLNVMFHSHPNNLSTEKFPFPRKECNLQSSAQVPQQYGDKHRSNDDQKSTSGQVYNSQPAGICKGFLSMYSSSEANCANGIRLHSKNLYHGYNFGNSEIKDTKPYVEKQSMLDLKTDLNEFEFLSPMGESSLYYQRSGIMRQLECSQASEDFQGNSQVEQVQEMSQTTLPHPDDEDPFQSDLCSLGDDQFRELLNLGIESIDDLDQFQGHDPTEWKSYRGNVDYGSHQLHLSEDLQRTPTDDSTSSPTVKRSRDDTHNAPSYYDNPVERLQNTIGDIEEWLDDSMWQK